MTPRDREILASIAENARRVDDYVRRVGAGWAGDGMAVDAIAKRLEQIGELAKRLSPDAISEMETVDWRGVKGMREVLAHAYEEVDVAVLEDVLATKLPALRQAVSRWTAEPSGEPGRSGDPGRSGEPGRSGDPGA